MQYRTIIIRICIETEQRMNFWWTEADIPAAHRMIGMSAWTKAMSVGFKRKESGIETVLVTLHFDEQRLIGFLSDLHNCACIIILR